MILGLILFGKRLARAHTKRECAPERVWVAIKRGLPTKATRGRRPPPMSAGGGGGFQGPPPQPYLPPQYKNGNSFPFPPSPVPHYGGAPPVDKGGDPWSSGLTHRDVTPQYMEAGPAHHGGPMDPEYHGAGLGGARTLRSRVSELSQVIVCMGVTMVVVVLRHGGGAETDGIVALFIVGALLQTVLAHLYGPLQDRPRMLVALRVWLVWLVYNFAFSVAPNSVFGTWASVAVGVAGAVLSLMGRVMPWAPESGCRGLPQTSTRLLLMLSMLLLLMPNAQGNVFFGDTTIAAVKVGVYFFMFFLVDYTYPRPMEGDVIAMTLSIAWLLFVTPWFWFFALAEVGSIICHKSAGGVGDTLGSPTGPLLPHHHHSPRYSHHQDGTYHQQPAYQPAYQPVYYPHNGQQHDPYAQQTGGYVPQGVSIEEEQRRVDDLRYQQYQAGGGGGFDGGHGHDTYGDPLVRGVAGARQADMIRGGAAAPPSWVPGGAFTIPHQP